MSAARRLPVAIVVVIALLVAGGSLATVHRHRDERGLLLLGPCTDARPGPFDAPAEDSSPSGSAALASARRGLDARLHAITIDTGEQRSFRELIDQQELYLLDDHGMPAGVTSRANRALHDDAVSPKMRAIARGVAQLSRRLGSPGVRGIALATSPDGFAAAGAAALVVGDSSGLSMLGSDDNLAQQMYDTLRADDRGIIAFYYGPTDWIVIGPEGAFALKRAFDESAHGPVDAADLWGVYVLRHELEHSISPESVGDAIVSLGQHSWLEEGSASTLAGWPGSIGDTADALGITIADRAKADDRPFDELSRDPDGYGDFVRTVRGVLRTAGLHPEERGDYAAARKLIQGGTAGGMDDRMARAIIRHAGLRASACRNLASRIVALHGRPGGLAALRDAVDHSRGLPPVSWR